MACGRARCTLYDEYLAYAMFRGNETRDLVADRDVLDDFGRMALMRSPMASARRLAPARRCARHCAPAARGAPRRAV